GTFDRHLGVGRRVEVGGGGTRPRILRPLRRRTARKTARRRRGDGPGGHGRRRAFDGCVRASHGTILMQAVEQNKNIVANGRHARGGGGKREAIVQAGGGPPPVCWNFGTGTPAAPLSPTRPGRYIGRRVGRAL